ncbi:MAG TPA: MgtC/SapB family protein [Longimicrobiales bacterium]|nr:MgtC/SapB family protein [Longimicrobiales bacterium]
MPTDLLAGLGSAVPLELLGKVGLAALLGGMVGLERELFEKPAGLRTLILICLGSALFTDLSLRFATWGSSGTPADPSRIAAQVVTGIGFLGAGAIIQSRGSVIGLTTAATIWVVAAIGMGVGAGAIGTAVVATLALLVVLVGLGAIERRVDAGWTGLVVVVRVGDQPGELKRVLRKLQELGLKTRLEDVVRDGKTGSREARLHTKVPRARLPDLVEKLFDLPEVVRTNPK